MTTQLHRSKDGPAHHTLIYVYQTETEGRDSSFHVFAQEVMSLTYCVFDSVSLIDQYGAQSTSSNTP